MPTWGTYRRAISLAWHVVALPALILNYLGQAAVAIEIPSSVQNERPVFPDGALRYCHLPCSSSWPRLRQ